MNEARPLGDIARDLAPMEPRTSDLQVQFEQVGVALQQLRHTQQSMQEMEERLAEMTRECSTILDRWAKNDEKHATAVVELHSRLGEWNDIERRLLSESSSRVHQFERSLQHEWNALRLRHEEPLKQLDTQAARIAETCLAAVDHALRGFERAEARLTTLEQDMHREMGDLAREVREAVAEFRQSPPQLGARQPWALDNVVRLHNELRAEGTETSPPGPAAAGAGAVFGSTAIASARARLPELTAVAVDGGDTGLRHLREFPSADDAGHAADPGHSHIGVDGAADRISWRSAPVLAVILVAAMLGAFALFLQSQVRSSLDIAAQRAEAAERGASQTRALAHQQIEAAQRASDERLAAAQRAARDAQRLATLLAAPDLRRFDLAGAAGTGQVLWSRGQGVAFNSISLRSAPDGKVYQLWLRTRDRAINVGPIAADPSGRTSVVFDTPGDLPRPIVQAAITLEPAGGSSQPAAETLLASPMPAAAPLP